MRIAEVCPYDLAVPGGVQAQVRGLSRELRRRGHEVDVIGPNARGFDWIGPIVPVPSNDAVARVALGPRVSRRLRRELSAYDLVHVHEPLMPTVSTSAVRSTHRVVGTFHADPSVMVRTLLARGLGRTLLRRLSGSTAVSPVAASAVPGLALEIIPNAVEDDLFEPSESRRESVLFVGRDEPRKGLAVLLEAWEHVQREAPNARLTVISDRTSGPQGIEWLGPVTDAVRIEKMRQALVVCTPNLRGESFGMVAAEALAAGCSLVATDLPAFRWVAGEQADFVAAGDSHALAQALAGRLSHPRQETEVRRHAQRFRWSEVADLYEDLFRRVRPAA